MIVAQICKVGDVRQFAERAGSLVKRGDMLLVSSYVTYRVVDVQVKRWKRRVSIDINYILK
jgi:hypothetical protein